MQADMVREIDLFGFIINGTYMNAYTKEKLTSRMHGEAIVLKALCTL